MSSCDRRRGYGGRAPFGETTRPRPFRAPRYTVSTMSINSCLSVIAQLILLLFPVPRSIMMCLLRKKNITVQGSYSSYMALNAVTCSAQESLHSLTCAILKVGVNESLLENQRREDMAGPLPR